MIAVAATEARTQSTIRLRNNERATSPDVRTAAAAVGAVSQVREVEYFFAVKSCRGVVLGRCLSALAYFSCSVLSKVQIVRLRNKSAMECCAQLVFAVKSVSLS